jgi:hypothetical protein
MRTESVGSGRGWGRNAHSERVNGTYSVVRGCSGTRASGVDQAGRLVALTAITADGGRSEVGTRDGTLDHQEAAR